MPFLDFRIYYNNASGSDFQIILNGEPINLHRFILADGSLFFRKLFERDPDQNQLDIDDPTDATETILRSFYGFTPDINEDNYVQLLITDSYYLTQGFTDYLQVNNRYGPFIDRLQSFDFYKIFIQNDRPDILYNIMIGNNLLNFEYVAYAISQDNVISQIPRKFAVGLKRSFENVSIRLRSNVEFGNELDGYLEGDISAIMRKFLINWNRKNPKEKPIEIPKGLPKLEIGLQPAEIPFTFTGYPDNLVGNTSLQQSVVKLIENINRGFY